MNAPASDCPQESFEVIGVAVQVTPRRLEAVAKELTGLRGVEVHGSDPRGTIVITIEEIGGEKYALDLLSDINRIPGVLTTSLVYHHAETESR